MRINPKSDVLFIVNAYSLPGEIWDKIHKIEPLFEIIVKSDILSHPEGTPLEVRRQAFLQKDAQHRMLGLIAKELDRLAWKQFRAERWGKQKKNVTPDRNYELRRLFVCGTGQISEYIESAFNDKNKRIPTALILDAAVDPLQAGTQATQEQILETLAKQGTEFIEVQDLIQANTEHLRDLEQWDRATSKAPQEIIF